MNTFSINLEQALAIENELNKVQFDGIEFGGIMADYIYQSLYFHSQNVGIKTQIYNQLLYYKLLFDRSVASNELSIIADAKYAIGYILNTPRLNEFFTPLLPYFNNELTFISTIDQVNVDWEKHNPCYYKGLSKNQLLEWKNAYHIFKHEFDIILKEIRSKYRIPLSVIYQFKQISIIQTKRIIALQNAFKNSNLKAILVDHDRQSITSCIVLTAKKLNIRTYTLIHGSTFPADDYYPLLADFMFCWSDEQKKQMQSVGISDDRLIISGNQKLTRNFRGDKTALKKKFNIPTHQQTILVATNPIQFDEKIKFVADACEALYDENRFILIRIHPSENISDYAFLKQQYSNLHITGSHEQTAEESLAISDCIVCHNTVFLLEALIKRIPVYIFAPSYISYPLGVGEDAYRAGAAMLSNTITELKSQIGNTLSTKNIEAGESYVNSICNYFGDDAAKRIYTELKKTA